MQNLTDLQVKNYLCFFLHTDNRNTFNKFNDHFLDFFKIKGNHKSPFVLFFKLLDDNIQDIRVVELQQENYLFAFNELYEIIEQSINQKTNSKFDYTDNKFVKFSIYTVKILYTATLEYFIGLGYAKV